MSDQPPPPSAPTRKLSSRPLVAEPDREAFHESDFQHDPSNPVRTATVRQNSMLDTLRTHSFSKKSPAGSTLDLPAQGQAQGGEGGHGQAEGMEGIPLDPSYADPNALTPLRAHYLKRQLTTLALEAELEHLTTPAALSYLGPPFLPSTALLNGQPRQPPQHDPHVVQKGWGQTLAEGAYGALAYVPRARGSPVPGSTSTPGSPGHGQSSGSSLPGSEVPLAPLPPSVAQRLAAASADQLPSGPDSVDLPFLRYFFHHFVLSFPFLHSAPPSFYSHKLQPFAYSFFSRNFSSSIDRDEETKRRRMAGKLEKHLGLVMASAIKLSDNRGREDVVRVMTSEDGQTVVNGLAMVNGGGMDAQEGLDVGLAMAEERGGVGIAGKQRGAAGFNAGEQQQQQQQGPRPGPRGPLVRGQSQILAVDPSAVGFNVNVVTVRTVTVKMRVRSKDHEEFIIRTRQPGVEDVFVSRRYGDFNRLADELRNAYPESDVRPPPAKDRRTVDVRANPNPQPEYSSGGGVGASSPPPPNGGPAPYAPYQRTTSPRTSAEASHSSLPGGFDASPPSSSSHKLKNKLRGGGGGDEEEAGVSLNRERNRLTLRAYLHHLLSNPILGSSSILQSFLLDSPTTVTPAELEDIKVREEMDRVREAEVARFRAEVIGRVRELEGYLRGFREELVQRDGLSRVFGTIKRVPTVDGLPIEYRKVIEWARLSFASTIYTLFIGSDDSSSLFSQLRRIHGIMPYFMLRGILRISNPVAMIRAFLDLFLARPFGQTSLLQRMFSSGLNEEVKEMKEDLRRVEERIGDERLCEKVDRWCVAPREIQDIYRSDAAADNVDIMTTILRSPEHPTLDPATHDRITRADSAYKKYLLRREELEDAGRLEEDEGPDPNDHDAWLFEDLHIYLRLATRVRDKEQMIELIFEGATSDLLKEIITIFYEPLAKVYKAANIADSLYDLQRFLDDLIKTVEECEMQTVSNPQRTVQTFIDLVARHEGSFYKFVHQVHSKGEGLFDRLMMWIELFVDFVRDGLPQPISLEALLPAGGEARTKVLNEVDAIIEYHRKLKEAHWRRMRRRLMAKAGEGLSGPGGGGQQEWGDGVAGAYGGSAGGAEREKEKARDRAFVEGVVGGLGIGGVVRDVEEIEAEESDEEAAGFDSAEEGEDDDEGSSTKTKGKDRKQSVGEPSSSRAPTAATSTSGDAKPLPPPPTGGATSPRLRKKQRNAIEPPELTALTELVPIFVELVRPMLRSNARVTL